MKVKNCPCCGRKNPELERYVNEAVVRCSRGNGGCGLSMSVPADMMKKLGVALRRAVRLWNRREGK